MQRALAAILCLTVAWHAMLGCCWHHAHTDGPADSGHCDGHRHSGHSHDAQPSQHEGDRDDSPEPCEENSCLFVRGEQVRTLDPIDEFTWAPAINFAPAAYLAESALTPAPEDGPPPPAVPRHLQFSVLLI
jgi:hypothetical protein